MHAGPAWGLPHIWCRVQLPERAEDTLTPPGTAVWQGAAHDWDQESASRRGWEYLYISMGRVSCTVLCPWQDASARLGETSHCPNT